MKRASFSGESRFVRFINGRGFYAVLAVCLLAVGGVAVALTLPQLTEGGEETTPPPTSDVQPVEQVVTDQPDDRTTTTTTTVVTTTTTAPAATDLYVLPFGNLVQKAFSEGEPVYSETMQDWRIHNGVDFAGDEGQTVKALADGTVVSVEEHPLWGSTVCIDHGMEVLSYYCGVKTTLTPQAKVSVGQAIGTLEEIPCESAQAPHLHLEMTVEGQAVNPVEALGREVRYAEEETE